MVYLGVLGALYRVYVPYITIVQRAAGRIGTYTEIPDRKAWQGKLYPGSGLDALTGCEVSLRTV